jgi:NAD(P)-dependent dehydrogenase (short-subunit alcohol dehydrogenase family)
MRDLSGRVAVVTGGASGIGLATAKRLAREGMKLVLADVRADSLEPAGREVEKLGAEVLCVQTDVGELAQVQALADRTFERFGAAHVLFNNAGVAVFGPVQDMRHQDWEWLIRVNLWGVIHGVECFVPRMIEQGQGGHVINTASFAGLVPNRGLGVYCVTKYGVVALSECMRTDLKPDGIGVSVLCPMRVETNIGECERTRPAELRTDREPPPPPPEPSGAARDLAGGVLSAERTADLVRDAIVEDRLYVVTHPESREFVRRRFERIDRAYESLEG